MKRKAGIFKFLWFKERSRKLRLRDGLVWAVGLTIEIKLWEHVAGMVRQGQAPSCARMGHMLQEQYTSWCRRNGYGSFLGCSGDSLQEQCTRYDIENWRSFVPALSQQNFIHVAVQFSPRKRILLTHYRETLSCPRSTCLRVCRSLVRIHSSTRQLFISILTIKYLPLASQSKCVM